MRLFLENPKRFKEVIAEIRKTYRFNDLTSVQRRLLIRSLKGTDPIEFLRLGELVLDESRFILGRKGRWFDVEYQWIATLDLNPNECYYNAAKMSEKGYGYVEGYTLHKKNRHKDSPRLER